MSVLLFLLRNRFLGKGVWDDEEIFLSIVEGHVIKDTVGKYHRLHKRLEKGGLMYK